MQTFTEFLMAEQEFYRQFLYSFDHTVQDMQVRIGDVITQDSLQEQKNFIKSLIISFAKQQALIEFAIVLFNIDSNAIKLQLMSSDNDSDKIVRPSSEAIKAGMIAEVWRRIEILLDIYHGREVKEDSWKNFIFSGMSWSEEEFADDDFKKTILKLRTAILHVTSDNEPATDDNAHKKQRVRGQINLEKFSEILSEEEREILKRSSRILKLFPANENMQPVHLETIFGDVQNKDLETRAISMKMDFHGDNTEEMLLDHEIDLPGYKRFDAIARKIVDTNSDWDVEVLKEAFKKAGILAIKNERLTEFLDAFANETKDKKINNKDAIKVATKAIEKWHENYIESLTPKPVEEPTKPRHRQRSASDKKREKGSGKVQKHHSKEAKKLHGDLAAEFNGYIHSGGSATGSSGSSSDENERVLPSHIASTSSTAPKKN